MSVTSKAFHCLPDMVLDCWVNKWENIAFDEIHRSSVPPPFSVVDDSYFLPTVQSTNFCPDDLRFPTCLKTFHRSRRCSQLPSKTSSKLPSAHSTWHLRRASWWAKRLYIWLLQHPIQCVVNTLFYRLATESYLLKWLSFVWPKDSVQWIFHFNMPFVNKRFEAKHVHHCMLYTKPNPTYGMHAKFIYIYIDSDISLQQRPANVTMPPCGLPPPVNVSFLLL